MQAGLRLRQRQVQEMVGARRRLLAALLTVQERREAAILAMGLALLQPPALVRPVPSAVAAVHDDAISDRMKKASMLTAKKLKNSHWLA